MSFEGGFFLSLFKWIELLIKTPALVKFDTKTCQNGLIAWCKFRRFRDSFGHLAQVMSAQVMSAQVMSAQVMSRG